MNDPGPALSEAEGLAPKNRARTWATGHRREADFTPTMGLEELPDGGVEKNPEHYKAETSC